ncbi:MAG: phage major capsid protein [bacterium]|nr:phage major capsid protein [bacterium]
MALPPGSTAQSLSDLLQIKYAPGLTRQFNDSHPNLTYIRQNSEDVVAEGDKCVIGIETGLNEAGGTHGESADVPTAVSPTVRNVEVRLKQMTFRARISWKFMKKARTTTNAFARGLDLTLRSTRTAMMLTANTYTWGDGSGVICRVLTETDDGGANGTLTLDRAMGQTDGGAPFLTIRQNQVLHILDTKGFNGTTDRGQMKVNTVDLEDNAAWTKVTVTMLVGTFAAAAIAVDDYVYLQNSITGWTDTDEVEDNSPPMGLPGFYDDALVDPLQGLAIATEPFWRPHKRTATQPTIIGDMNRARDAQMKRAPGSRVEYLISSYESRERWHDALVQKAEWRNVQKLDGSWDVAVYAGRPFFADHTAPDGKIYFIPGGSSIQRYNVADFIEVVNDDNSTLHLVPNKTVFDILFTTLYEFGISRRNNLVSLNGVTW